MSLDIDVRHMHQTKRRKVELAFACSIPATGLIGLYGPSGIGKSSVLRWLAGLENPDQGRISYTGVPWMDKEGKLSLSPALRRVGMVFQENNLFPNMTVERNLSYVSPNGNIPDDVSALLDQMGLRNLMAAYPAELSGGQKQRVALLRALCHHPQVLLLDEPFSALDDGTIGLLIQEIKAICARRQLLVLFVTHRKDVLFALAEKVVHYAKQGEVRIGSPEEVISPTSWG